MPSHLPIKNVCQLFLENEHSRFYEDIIVLKNQCFYGIVTIKDLRLFFENDIRFLEQFSAAI